MLLGSASASTDVMTGSDRRANGYALTGWKPFVEMVAAGGPWGITNWRYFIGNGVAVPDTPDGRGVFWWDTGSFDVSGYTPQFRLVVNTFTNTVSNNANYTVAVWRVSGFSGMTPTLGSLVDYVVNAGTGTPVAQSSGAFLFAVSPSTPMNSGLQVHITAKLEQRWVEA